MTAPVPPVLDPIVLEHRLGADSAELELVVPHDLHFFKGHFPSAPVVPGVVQIKWAIAFAQKYFGIEGSFTALENVKFQRVMTPKSRLTLALHYNPATRKLRFSFASVDVRYSSGRVVLGTAP